MLAVIRSMKELSFGALMEVYAEGNRNSFPHLTPEQALVSAEQEQYTYLRHCFFRISGAMLCVWKEGERYVSALRLEPYRDGLLLTALETAPDRRNQGYAGMLIQAVQTKLAEQGPVRLYSHIRNDNPASIAVHSRCGFKKVLDHAVYLDGSVSNHADTYLFEA